MTVKVRLKEVRTARNISQNELARLLSMSLANIQKIEYGKAKAVPLETLDKLCKVLKCEPGDLLQFVPDDDGQDGIIDKGDNKKLKQSGFIEDNPPYHRSNTHSLLFVVTKVPESA